MEKTLDLVNDPDVKQKLLEKVRECWEGVSLATVLRALTVYAPPRLPRAYRHAPQGSPLT
jgi:hypothetical protein